MDSLPTVNDESLQHSPTATPRIPTLDDLHRLNTELDEIDQTLAELDAPAIADAPRAPLLTSY